MQTYLSKINCSCLIVTVQCNSQYVFCYISFINYFLCQVGRLLALWSCRKGISLKRENTYFYIKPKLMEKWPSQNVKMYSETQVHKIRFSASALTRRPIFYIYIYLFFLSLRAGGILQILQSDWFRERAVFYDRAR